MTQPSEMPTEPSSWNPSDWVVYARDLAERLSAAQSALAEKERELTEVQAEAFDKIMAAEAHAAEAEKVVNAARKLLARNNYVKGMPDNDPNKGAGNYLADAVAALGEGKETKR